MVFLDATMYTRHNDRTIDSFLELGSEKLWFVDAFYVTAAFSFATVTINPAIYLHYLVSQCQKTGILLQRCLINEIAEPTPVAPQWQTS